MMRAIHGFRRAARSKRLLMPVLSGGLAMLAWLIAFPAAAQLPPPPPPAPDAGVEAGVSAGVDADLEATGARPAESTAVPPGGSQFRQDQYGQELRSPSDAGGPREGAYYRGPAQTGAEQRGAYQKPDGPAQRPDQGAFQRGPEQRTAYQQGPAQRGAYQKSPVQKGYAGAQQKSYAFTAYGAVQGHRHHCRSGGHHHHRRR